MAHYKRNTVIGSAVAFIVGLSIGVGILYVPHQAAEQTPSMNSVVQNGCTVTYPTGLPLNSKIRLGNGSSSIFLCVEYYYYNSTSTINLNLSGGKQLGLYAATNGNGPRTIGVGSNFTIVSSLESLVIGGPNNENEGATVVYSMSPIGIKNGSYILDIGWLANSQEDCASEYQLVVGTGIPNYYVGGSCTSPLSDHYQTNPEGFVNGFVYAEINGTA